MKHVRRSACLAATLCALLASAGCSGISVRPVRGGDLPDTWKASTVLADELSPRSLQTLRQLDLDDLYRRKPDEAAARLHDLAVKEPHPDLLFALAEIHYVRGQSAQRWDCASSIGHYYLSAGYAYHYLFATCDGDEGHTLTPRDAFDPRFRLACDLYNAGLAKCLRAAQRSGHLDPRHELRVPTGDGKTYLLSVAHGGFDWKPEDFGPLRFADDFEVSGLTNTHRSYGLGVPLIGTRAAGKSTPYYPASVSFPVTAFFRFEGSLADLGQCRDGRLELFNPLNVQTVQVRGRAVPLQTDLTTPLAFCLAHSGFDYFDYTGFFCADRVQDRTGLQLLEPYQPGKIPVVLVHGLLSSPLTWAPLLNDLRADPVLRERYQFWVYSYPTSNPYLATAADLRRTLGKLKKDLDPDGKDIALEHMVFVGHSMGGLVARLMTVKGGDDFWGLVSDRPFADLKLKPKTRAELEQVFYFDRVPGVERVVFISTPHHGSKLSPSPLGRLAVRLAGVPRAVREVAADLVEENPDLAKVLTPDRLPTSVDLLAPDAPALTLLSGRSRPPRVRYHSIVGVVPPSQKYLERWVAGGDATEPSDGVVPYRSAHLDNAESEVTVPAAHVAVHHHALAILEVRRILLEHLAEQKTDRLEIIPAHAEERSSERGASTP